MIVGRLVRLMEAQERFDRLQAQARRLGARLVDLSYANPRGPLDPDVRAVMQAALATDRDLAFQYTPIGGSRPARKVVADALTSSHGEAFTWQDVVLTNGAAGALALVLRALGEPGDEVIVPVPCWLDHPLLVEAADRTAVLVPLAGGFELDVAAIERVLSARTVAVLLGNPGNPTGRAYDKASLAALGDVLAEAERRFGRGITLVADEAHRDHVGSAFTPSLAHHDRALTVYSFGKYHTIQGQRLGYAAVSPRHPDRAAVAAELVRWSRIAGNATPTSLMQLALPGLLNLHHDPGDLDHWRARYLAELRRAGYEVVEPDGTFFLYVRTPPGYGDGAWAETLALRWHVLVVPAPVFHHTGYFRLSLTATSDALARALTALRQAHPRQSGVAHHVTGDGSGPETSTSAPAPTQRSACSSDQRMERA